MKPNHSRSRKNDYDEHVQSLRELQKWAKGMGAPRNVLQDLCKLEENKDNLHKAFSGQRGEMLKHIIKHVKPLHEAENIKKTVLLHKMNTAAETVAAGASNVQSKPSDTNYLLLNEKQEKIKELKEKCKREEKVIKWYKKKIDEKISECKQISQDTHDMLEKSVILELKNKLYKKQIDQWNETKKNFKIMNMRFIELKTTDTKEAQKKVGNDVCSIISKMLETSYLCGNNQEEIASSADQFIKDISELTFSTSPEAIVARLTNIVKGCSKVIINMNKTDLHVENFSQCSKGTDEYLTEFYQLQAEKTEESKKIKSMVEKKGEVIKILKRELMELFDKRYLLSVSINNETRKFRNDISDYLDLHIEKTRMSETNVFIRGNIETLSHEIDMKKSENPENLVNKFRFMHTLRNYLKTHTKRVKCCMDDKYKTSVAFCRQPNYIGLKGVDFESVRDMMFKEVAMTVQTPSSIRKSLWETGTVCMQSEVKQKLSVTPEEFKCADHMVIRNIVELLITRNKTLEFQYKKDLCVSTATPFNTEYNDHLISLLQT